MVLHHLPEPRRALREAWRILKDGGTLLIVDLIQHEDESMREAFGDHWLGFQPDVLEGWLREAAFDVLQSERFELRKGLEGFIIRSQKINCLEGD
jgi:ArsR family transcriptional regulator